MPTRFPVFFRESQAMPSRGVRASLWRFFFLHHPSSQRVPATPAPRSLTPKGAAQLQTPSRRGSRGGVAVGAVETLLGGGHRTKAFLSATPRLSPVPVFVPVFSFLGR